MNYNMATKLGKDAETYKREYTEFMAKLRRFHDSKGTPFRRLPFLGGQYLDLYLLYKTVTDLGGWLKVTDDKKWKDVAKCFSLPATCTNAAFALRQHYVRYLESFERVQFFGEEADDVVSSSRPLTPVGGGSVSSYSSVSEVQPGLAMKVVSHDDKNFERLILSLQCGLPNEVDFAINVCMLLSNVNNSVFNLSKAPGVVDMLLAHVGVFTDDASNLKAVYHDWYKESERDFMKFWREMLVDSELKELYDKGGSSNLDCFEDSLFNKGHDLGFRDAEFQRVIQVCTILYNFAFDETNSNILATHPIYARFLFMCMVSKSGAMRRHGIESLTNLAEKMNLEPLESSNTHLMFRVLCSCLEDTDRYVIVSAMTILAKLCLIDQNSDIIGEGLDPSVYGRLINVLIITDVQLILASLELLYQLSGLGQTTSDHIANVRHGVDTLMSLVTLDVEGFGPKALSEVRVIDTRPHSRQQHQIPKIHRLQQLQQMQQQHNQAPVPVASPVPQNQTGTSPVASPVIQRPEADAEQFTLQWLKNTYEVLPNGMVSRIDLYADYLSSCSKLGRIGILNATTFHRLVKTAFPDTQLRRLQQPQQQYALMGIRRRMTPIPVQNLEAMPRPQLTPQPGQALHQDMVRSQTPPPQAQSPRQANSPASWGANISHPIPTRSPSSPRTMMQAGRLGAPASPGPQVQSPVRPQMFPVGQKVPVQGFGNVVRPQVPVAAAGNEIQSAVAPLPASAVRLPVVGQAPAQQMPMADVPGRQRPQHILPQPQPQNPNVHLGNMQGPIGTPPQAQGQMPVGQQRFTQYQRPTEAMLPENQVALRKAPMAEPKKPENAIAATPKQISYQPGLRPISPRPSASPSTHVNKDRHTFIAPQPSLSQAHPRSVQSPLVHNQRAIEPKPVQTTAMPTQVRPGMPGVKPAEQGMLQYRNMGTNGPDTSHQAGLQPSPSPTPFNAVPPPQPLGQGVMVARRESIAKVANAVMPPDGREEKIVMVENTAQQPLKENGISHSNHTVNHKPQQNGPINPPAYHNQVGTPPLQGTNNVQQPGNGQIVQMNHNSAVKRDNSVLSGVEEHGLKHTNDSLSPQLKKQKQMQEDLAKIADKIEPQSIIAANASTTNLINGEMSDSKLVDVLLNQMDNNVSKQVTGMNGFHNTVDQSSTASINKAVVENNIMLKQPSPMVHSAPVTSVTASPGLDLAHKAIAPKVVNEVTSNNQVLVDKQVSMGMPVGQKPVQNYTFPKTTGQPSFDNNVVNQTMVNATNHQRVGHPPAPGLDLSQTKTIVPSNRIMTPQPIQPQQPLATPNNAPSPAQLQQSANALANAQVRTSGQAPQIVTNNVQRLTTMNQTPTNNSTARTVNTPPSSVALHTNSNVQMPPGPPAPEAQIVRTPPTSMPDGGQEPQTPGVDKVEQTKPYRCLWRGCNSSYDSSKLLVSHMAYCHVPKDNVITICQWEGCPPLQRSRASLLFHVQQKHKDPTPIKSASNSPAEASSQSHPVPAHVWHMRRMMQAMRPRPPADDESPLTKGVRLTAALVLKNIARHSPQGRKMLSQHEALIAQLATADIEASGALAATLAELTNPKTKKERIEPKFWTLHAFS